MIIPYNTYNISCANQTEFNMLMIRLEHEGYKWNGNELPTKYDPYLTERRASNLPIVIKLWSDKTITYATNVDYCNEFEGTITLEKYIKETKMNFKKSDLKDGMIVKLRDNGLRFVFKNKLLYGNGYADLNNYEDDLTHICNNDLDIMVVYDIEEINSLDLGYDVVGEIPTWKREEVVEMTVSEIEKKLGIKNLKVVAEKGE